MKSADLIAKHGRYWSVYEHKVFEEIGSADPDSKYQFALRADAEKAAIQNSLNKLKRRVAYKETYLKLPEVRLKIFLAKYFFVDTKAVKAELLQHLREISSLKHEIDDILSGKNHPFLIIDVPTELSGPIILDIGTPIWEVNWSWPLSSDLTIECLQVNKVHIKVSHNNAAVSSYYFIGTKENPYQKSITYDVAENDPNPTSEIECNTVGGSLFINLPAAIARAKEHANTVSDRVARIECLCNDRMRSAENEHAADNSRSLKYPRPIG